MIEVQLVDSVADLFCPVSQFDYDHRICFNEAECGRVEEAGVSNRLHPCVAVWDQVAIIVESCAYIAQIVPNAFGPYTCSY